MARALKVFRTAIGFHDAYVAAPSQKAALEAWGTSSNLFARGEAEVVTDTALTKDPLSRPGEVIKRLRGTAEQHLASLPRARSDKAIGKKRGAPASARTKAKPKPRPSRSQLDRQEARLSDLERSQSKEMADIERQIAALRKQAGALEQRHERARDAQARKVEQSCDAYEKALRAWE